MEFIEESDRIFMRNGQGDIIAKIDFPAVSDDTVDITHTVVDKSLRGQGIADKLVRALVEKAKSENKKVIPSCSYAVSWFELHPEESNILAEKE